MDFWKFLSCQFSYANPTFETYSFLLVLVIDQFIYFPERQKELLINLIKTLKYLTVMVWEMFTTYVKWVRKRQRYLRAVYFQFCETVNEKEKREMKYTKH